jgi:mRNA interferase RelE/StbE
LIPSPYRENIEKKIEMKLSIDPYKYGKPLDGNLKGKWSLRIGSYRVIYEIFDKEIRVLILTIDVRGNVYD